MSGFEGLNLLAQFGPDIPVLITTGVPEPDIDIRLNHCGASAFLLKPFGPRDLVQAVALALALRPKPAPVATVS